MGPGAWSSCLSSHRRLGMGRRVATQVWNLRPPVETRRLRPGQVSIPERAPTRFHTRKPHMVRPALNRNCDRRDTPRLRPIPQYPRSRQGGTRTSRRRRDQNRMGHRSRESHLPRDRLGRTPLGSQGQAQMHSMLGQTRGPTQRPSPNHRHQVSHLWREARGRGRNACARAI